MYNYLCTFKKVWVEKVSYYLQSKYQFSHHVILPVKQRLNLKHLNDMELKMHCLQLINEAFYVIDIKDDIYVQINDSDLYFVIDKKSNLIKTITPISQERLLSIIEI
ncbi:hypothetical protein [Spiroplasma endosymbiont of Eupeodes luniger]|uniref:hypothetical protein n=1 Tax=Spiroplasma endosymbiont of Eupeodes luniger TaxID=3066300 RepID=UPI0030CBCFEF